MKKDICDCDQCFKGKLSKCVFNDLNEIPINEIKEINDVGMVDDNEGNDEDNCEVIDVLDAIIPGNCIALQAPKEVRESFYLCIVNFDK